MSIWKCVPCEFFFCFPVPQGNSSSAGENSVQTDEDYTTGLLSDVEWKLAAYSRLAERRHERYSSTLGVPRYRLLEIGCGAGGLARKYLQLGVDYLGIDIDDRVIQNAVKAQIRNIYKLDFLEMPNDRQFDVIAFSQVLEHIKQPAKFVDKVNALLAAGGIVHCDVPNHNSLPSLIYRMPISAVRWGAITYPYHLFAYTKSSLQALFRRYFSVEVFDAPTSDPLWGQAVEPSGVLARLGPLLKALNAGSLLVAYGTKPRLG